MKSLTGLLAMCTLLFSLSGCHHAASENKISNSSSMYSYSDGAGNAYHISENSITYDPVIPMESSSGEYSGGEPAEAAITAEQYQELIGLIDAAIADESAQMENRAMMTGYIQYGEESVVLKPNSDVKNGIEEKLKNLMSEESETAEMTTVSGELLNTKGGPSVDGVYLPENEYDEYIGKNVEVTGKVVTVEGGELVNEAGDYSSGWEGTRKVMESVDSIKVVE